MDGLGILAAAANLRDGENPSYTASDFREVMPQFTEKIIPDTVLGTYVQMAHAAVKQARWHAMWAEGMRLFIAHFATLYAAGVVYLEKDAQASPSQVATAGSARGAVSAKQVDAVSIQYNLAMVADDHAGWGAWKETLYGEQFATLARMLGKGGMFVR